jgi:hypothetical protein
VTLWRVRTGSRRALAASLGSAQGVEGGAAFGPRSATRSDCRSAPSRPAAARWPARHSASIQPLASLSLAATKYSPCSAGCSVSAFAAARWAKLHLSAWPVSLALHAPAAPQIGCADGPGVQKMTLKSGESREVHIGKTAAAQGTSPGWNAGMPLVRSGRETSSQECRLVAHLRVAGQLQTKGGALRQAGIRRSLGALHIAQRYVVLCRCRRAYGVGDTCGNGSHQCPISPWCWNALDLGHAVQRLQALGLEQSAAQSSGTAGPPAAWRRGSAAVRNESASSTNQARCHLCTHHRE